MPERKPDKEDVRMYIKEEEGSRGGPRTGWRSYDQTTSSVGTTAGQHGQEGRSATRKGTGEKGGKGTSCISDPLAHFNFGNWRNLIELN